MGNLKMKNNAMVITGSNGAAAQKLISYFADSFDVVIGITRHPVIKFEQENINIIIADISDKNQLPDLLDKIKLNHDSIDCWINCVGGFDMGKSVEQDEDGWEQMNAINFTTCLHGSQTALNIMKHQGYGKIINIGSRAAIDGFPNAAPYLVSKSSVHALTKYIALENSNNKITCNAILPGVIDTPANREAMPNEDFSGWETPLQIAEKIKGVIASDVTGELIYVS